MNICEGTDAFKSKEKNSAQLTIISCCARGGATEAQLGCMMGERNHCSASCPYLRCTAFEVSLHLIVTLGFANGH
jgi:hypothetical protein